MDIKRPHILHQLHACNPADIPNMPAEVTSKCHLRKLCGDCWRETISVSSSVFSGDSIHERSELIEVVEHVESASGDFVGITCAAPGGAAFLLVRCRPARVVLRRFCEPPEFEHSSQSVSWRELEWLIWAQAPRKCRIWADGDGELALDLAPQSSIIESASSGDSGGSWLWRLGDSLREVPVFDVILGDILLSLGVFSRLGEVSPELAMLGSVLHELSSQ